MLCPEVCVLQKCGVSRFFTLNLRVHSFTRVCVESASTPGILREDQDSHRKKTLQSPAEDIKAQSIEQSKVGPIYLSSCH